MASRLGKIPATSVRRRTSSFNRSSGFLDEILRQASLGEAGEGQRLFAGTSEVVCGRGVLVFQGIDDTVELSVYFLGIGLVIDSVQQGLDSGPGGLRGGAHQVGRIMGAAPLPGCTQ